MGDGQLGDDDQLAELLQLAPKRLHEPTPTGGPSRAHDVHSTARG